MISKTSPTLSWAIGCLCTAWLMGVVCAVHISTWQAPEALIVFGSQHVWRGATAGFRAVVRDSASHVPTARTRLDVWLEDASGPGPVMQMDAQDAAAWTMPVPGGLGSTASLMIRVHPEHGPPASPIAIGLQVVDAPAPRPMALWPLNHHAPTVTTHAPGVTLSWAPTGGQFVVGLDNPGVALLQRDGHAWAHARVRCAALHLDTQTDDDGLFDIAYTPPLHPEPLRFVLGESAVPTWVDLVPRVQVAQVQLLTPTQCFARPKPLPVHIDTLPLRGPLAVDLWLDDLLLGTTGLHMQERHADVTLGIEAALPAGFLTLVAFRHVLNAETFNTATRPMGQSAVDAVAALASQHVNDAWLQAMAARHVKASERLTTFALARIKPQHQGTPVIFDNAPAMLANFNTQRNAVRQRIYNTMGGLMGLSGAAIGVAVWRMRRRLRRDVDAALADLPVDALADGDAAEQMTRLTHRAYLLLALLALALAGYGLLAVVTRLRWQ